MIATLEDSLQETLELLLARLLLDAGFQQIAGLATRVALERLLRRVCMERCLSASDNCGRLQKLCGRGWLPIDFLARGRQHLATLNRAAHGLTVSGEHVGAALLYVHELRGATRSRVADPESISHEMLCS